MSDFTMRLCDVLDVTGGDIGLKDYPIFDEAYRSTLNGRIIDHYYYDEIGHETIDVFVHQMRTKMNEIMPYFNKFYESERVKIDPLSTMDVTSESSGSQTSGSSSEASSESRNSSDSVSRAVQSETPQVRLSGDEDYATAASDTTAHGTGDASTSSSQKDSGEVSSSSSSRSHGYNGHTAALIQSWRDSFINVDMMVVTALEPLFMSVWNTNDRYTDAF